MGVVIWGREVASEVSKVYKSKTLPGLKGYKVELLISDQVLDVLEEDGGGQRIAAQMVEDAQKACEATVALLATELKKLDAECLKGTEDSIKKRAASFDVFIKSEVNKLGAKLKAIPEARWKAWVATQAQYKKYKVDTGIKIVMGTLGAVGSGLAIAAAVPTGGATLALGIVGGVKSGLELIKIGAKCAMEAEQVQKKVMLHLKAMSSIYGNCKGKSQKGAAKEAAMSALNALLPVELAPTLNQITSDCGLWDNKLAGVEINADKAANNAMNNLKLTDGLESKLKSSKSKDAGKILDKIKKLRIEIDKSLTKCTDAGERVTKGRAAHEFITKKLLPELRSKQPKWVDVFDKVAPVAVNLGLAAGGGADAFASAKSALEFTQASLDVANAILGEINNAIAD